MWVRTYYGATFLADKMQCFNIAKGKTYAKGFNTYMVAYCAFAEDAENNTYLIGVYENKEDGQEAIRKIIADLEEDESIDKKNGLYMVPSNKQILNKVIVKTMNGGTFWKLQSLAGEDFDFSDGW